MSTATVYRKTDRGQAEVGARKLKLNPRLRTMLILIDGAQDEPAVRDEAAKVGAPADFLEELVRLGLVERARESAMASTPANAPHAQNEYERFRAAKNFMNVTLVDALGIKSFFFTMKLERAGTLQDLRELGDAYTVAIAKAEGGPQGEVLGRRLKHLLD